MCKHAHLYRSASQQSLRLATGWLTPTSATPTSVTDTFLNSYLVLIVQIRFSRDTFVDNDDDSDDDDDKNDSADDCYRYHDQQLLCASQLQISIRKSVYLINL